MTGYTPLLSAPRLKAQQAHGTPVGAFLCFADTLLFCLVREGLVRACHKKIGSVYTVRAQ